MRITERAYWLKEALSYVLIDHNGDKKSSSREEVSFFPMQFMALSSKPLGAGVCETQKLLQLNFHNFPSQFPDKY